MFDYESLIETVDDFVVNQPGKVIVAFLLVTAVLTLGLGGTSTESGTSQFTDDSPAQAAFEDVNREFSPSFAPDTGSTQLIQRSQNVLSKSSMLRMLRAQERLSERTDLRVGSTSGAAHIVARQLDPNASSVDAKIRAIEDATPGQIDAAIRDAAENPGFTSSLSNDFNRKSASASATIGSVTHDLPGGISSSAGTSGGASPMQDIQTDAQRIVDTVGGDIRVFGSGLVSAEFSNVIFDSLILVVPAAVLFIFVFLVFAYRDPFDLVLGVVSLGMAIMWTFGFMGLAEIPFTQMLIAVPPLLLAVGIDFGIHAVNRYREERVEGAGIDDAMSVTTQQLLVAFGIVTGTTVLGFAANLTSKLGPIRDFGLVAAIGIVFTFLIFGIFLPAAKVYVDRWRDRLGLPEFGLRPLGDEDSLLGTVLPVGVTVARKVPKLFVLLMVVLTVASASYGAGVDTTFSQDDFLPPEETPSYLDGLPEPFAPSEYTVTGLQNFLDDSFATTQGSSVTVYVEGPLRKDYALESIRHANEDPPDSFVTEDGRAETESIVTVIDDYAAESGEFEQLVERNDVNDNGVPDDNLGQIYDELLASPYGDQARQYLTEDQRSMRVVYTVEADAGQKEVTADAKAVADRYRLYGIATGSTVVFQAVSDSIFASAITSLGVALVATALFLVFVYWLLEGRPSLGIVNLVPIVMTVALIAATMRYLGIPLNALTATILSITIGLGIDYSAHIVHRFSDEYNERGDVFVALDETVRGTGGALTGSMLTTTTGIGVLALAITPVLGQFGVVTALSITYSYLTSLVVTPSVVAVWASILE